MQKRKSHNKSRNGCQNCKKRHVKCDEQGPPCANCVSREITSSCVYENNPHSISPDARSSSTKSDESQRQSPSSSIVFENRRLFELELLHRWTSSTYKSLCNIPEEYYYMQVEVPQWGFKNPYLLDGIMAISALEIAVCETHSRLAEPEVYIQAAMEYYDKASASFRAALGNISAENVPSVFIFSCAAWCIQFALAQCARQEVGSQEYSILARVAGLMDLVIGSTMIGLANWEGMMNSPIAGSITTVLSSILDKTAPDPLDVTTNSTLERLSFVVDIAFPVPLNTEIAGDTALSQLQLYQTTVKFLRLCYVEDAKGSITGFCMSFPSLAGADFAVAVKESEPIALFILMHWAVLLHRYAGVVWWAGSAGRELVLEISCMLLQPESELALILECRNGIDWARQQVGLQELSLGSLSIF